MRALLSVSDKAGLVDLARGLTERGCELVSTGGTARALVDAGLAVKAVSDVTGFPELMDGRVKTLHPAIHGGILARRDRRDDLAALARHGITPIDIVVVNLYPFAKIAARPDADVETLVGEIDIGGPALVRAAAKNFRDVLVVVDPADYVDLLLELDRTNGPSRAFRLALARKAFAHTSAYDDVIAATFGSLSTTDGAYARARAPGPLELPARLRLTLRKLRDLRYGENPHQPAAWYAEDAPGPPVLRVEQGKEPSFTNLLDLDAASRLVGEFDEPAAVIIKHTNPCGAATADRLADAYQKARDADPVSAFGGIVGLNRRLDVATARAITATFIEAVIAPGVDEAARLVLAAKSAMRVVTMSAGDGSSADPESLELRTIVGGLLAQRRDVVAEARAAWPGPGGEAPPGLRVVTRRSPSTQEWRALQFAWRVSAHVKSNAVIFTALDRTLAIGAGQMSRVDAVNVAVMKAAMSLVGSVAASDAFFPFRDGLDAVAAAGASAVIQPGGSVRDAEVIAAADEHGLAMIFTGRRHFRH